MAVEEIRTVRRGGEVTETPLEAKIQNPMVSAVGTLAVRELLPAQLGLYAVVTPKQGGSFDAELPDGQGNVYLALSGYRTMQLPESVDAELLKPLQAVLQLQPVLQ